MAHRLRACVKAKGGDFEHKLIASSFRPLLVGQLFVLVNDFNVYQRLIKPFIVDFHCCLCDRVDFCPAMFYTVCAAKGMVFNLASPDVS